MADEINFDSPLWTEYILDQLNENEVWVDEKGQRYPRVKGLRRIMGVLFPYGWESTSKVHSVIPGNKMPTVTVVHTISVNPTNPFDRGFATTSSGVATCGEHNLDTNFPYPAESAETRARGRAYVNLLGLNVVTKEEIVKNVQKSEDEASCDDSKITVTVQKLLSVRCKRIGVDALSFVNIGKVKYDALSSVDQKKYNEMNKELNRIEQAITIVENNGKDALPPDLASSYSRYQKLKGKND